VIQDIYDEINRGCPTCKQDEGGQHEPNCPLVENFKNALNKGRSDAHRSYGI
jgi:hypothetical protein